MNRAVVLYSDMIHKNWFEERFEFPVYFKISIAYCVASIGKSDPRDILISRYMK